ncbi:MAG: hypothetical protein ABFS38_01550 [Bacteroidota bacterium]
MNKKIEEIHLINLSHTDFGYTDLPSSAWDYLVKNISLAMDYCEETKNYPFEAQFKWTVESIWVLEQFLNQASTDDILRFDQLVSDGLIEVTAMPGNMSCLVGAYEWENELDRLSFIYEKYKPCVAIQNDVNGIPLGMIGSLQKRNVKYMVTGSNPYSGDIPVPASSVFWWKNNENQRILFYLGEGYAEAYDYFHEKEWRRGPVPNRYDLWFNPPTGNEIFSSDKKDVLASFDILKSKLEKLIRQGYLYSVMQMSFSNQWFIDNDLPCRQLSEFIKAWNELELQPKLVFSTPAHFFEKVSGEISPQLKTIHGEWCDWWADGIAASPSEVAILQAAKRRNVDIGNAIKLMDASTPSLTKQITELNHDLTFASEHTWGAYDSVARPYGERTKGNHGQKFDYFYRADENSKRIKAEIIRNSESYKPFSRTRTIEVLNPGLKTRSGWAEISAQGLRFKANGAMDINTGQFYPFEETLASEWGTLEGSSLTPQDIPNDVWPFRPAQYRFHIENLHPGQKRKFELVQIDKPSVRRVHQSQFFDLVTEPKTGAIKNVIYKPLNKSLFDENSGYLPGQLVLERPHGDYSRNAIAERKLEQENLKETVPEVVEKLNLDSKYAIRFKTVQKERFAKRIEQQWDFFDHIPRIEITTTIWMKENLDPIAGYFAFPFDIKSPKAFYHSLGALVQVGTDQMPNTCGEYNTIQNGVSYQGVDISLAISTPDSPLGIFDSIVRGKKRTTFIPQTGHFYNIAFQNYWITNFSVLYPTKLVIRHIIECDAPGTNVLPTANNEFWTYPANEKLNQSN